MQMMKVAAVLIAAALLLAGLATTAVWAYPTTAERAANVGKTKVPVESPRPQPVTQIRVILPALWESNAQPKR
jgi:hypothetical protein